MNTVLGNDSIRSSSVMLTAIAAFAALASPTAVAYEVTYDFTAEGNVYTFTGTGADQEMGPTESISGSVTFDVRSEAPPAGADTDGSTYANVDQVPPYTTIQWAAAEFEGTYSGGSIAPKPSKSLDQLHYLTQVSNHYDPETSDYSNQASLKEYTSWDVDLFHTSYAFLNRFSYRQVPEWFPGLAWSGDMSPQYNYLYFGDYSRRDSTGIHQGYMAYFFLDSWVLSPGSMLRRLAGFVVGVGPGESLAGKVATARAYFAAGDGAATCAVLVDLANEIHAQTGKKIPADLAGTLMYKVDSINRVLGCE